MSRTAKWFFGLPVAFVVYVVLSAIIPASFKSEAGILVHCCILYSILILCIFCVTKFFLNFKFSRFFCSGRKFSIKALLLSFFLMLNASLGCELLHMAIRPSDYSRTAFTAPFAPVWISAFATICLAALAEELAFRSYICYFLSDEMPQDKKTRFRYCLVSAAFFCAAHISNPELRTSVIIPLLFYFMMGFTLMAVTLRSGGIETALGIHIANNTVPAFFFSYPSAVLTTKPLFINHSGISATTIITGAACLLIVVLLCRGLLDFSTNKNNGADLNK